MLLPVRPPDTSIWHGVGTRAVQPASDQRRSRHGLSLIHTCFKCQLSTALERQCRGFESGRVSASATGGTRVGWRQRPGLPLRHVMHQRDTPLLQNNRPAILEYMDIADVIPLRFDDLKQSSFIAQNEMRARLIVCLLALCSHWSAFSPY